MRFWDRVLVTETCWLWTGATQTRGYGSVGVGNGRTALAHRVAYQQTVGPIPDGMTIDHVCENKVCVNPDHLEVVTRAQAFGMNVIAWSRSLTPEKAAALQVTRAETLPSLCGQSDAVTVHVAYTPETHQLIGEAALSRMRHRAMLLNTSRAEVIDTAALRQAIADKGLRVAVDVFDREPEKAEGAFEDDLVGLPGVIGTHHVGASTEQAQSAIADETLRIVRGYVQSGEVQNCVNILPPPQTPARAELVVRHHDKVGVLAEVLGAIRRHNINVETMQNMIFQGAKAACARIRLGTRPSAELLAEIRSRTDEVIHVDVLELPEP